MNIRLTLHVLGGLLVFLAGMLLLPLAYSFPSDTGAPVSFLLSSAVSAVAGVALQRSFRSTEEMSYREAFAIVTFGWLFFALFGSLPFLFSGTILHPVDAFFESMSGFSTTGATVITDLNRVPQDVLLWRSLTQWMGGMGIIVLGLAILPFLGVGGMQLFEAEMSGPTADRLAPRIQDTAKLLWGIYFTITAAEVVLLLLGGMSLHEALCHSFATMATGGFSTRNESVGGFESRYLHVVITVFMFLAGTNFSLHYFAFRGRLGRCFADEQFRFYVGMTVASVLIVAAAVGLSVLVADGSPVEGDVVEPPRRTGPLDVLIDSAFQVVSILTATGFATADYELWPYVAQGILVLAMFFGGCAGSTAGGMKIMRVLLVVKHAQLQILRLIHPRGVRVLKLDHQPVSQEVMQSILGFVAAYLGVFVLATLLMAALGIDLLTSGGAVVACMSNVGPGIGEVGPTDTYAPLPYLAKLVLCACMLFGRLELFTVFVLFFPSFWRR
jgi:trk system potassium uptake protein TrkH